MAWKREGVKDKRLAYVKAAISIRKRQLAIVSRCRTQNLTWDVIFAVGEAFFIGRPIFATNISHVVVASKSSTINCIEELVKSGILARQLDKTDKRRKNISFSDKFKSTFINMVDDSIEDIFCEPLLPEVV